MFEFFFTIVRYLGDMLNYVPYQKEENFNFWNILLPSKNARTRVKIL